MIMQLSNNFRLGFGKYETTHGLANVVLGFSTTGGWAGLDLAGLDSSCCCSHAKPPSAEVVGVVLAVMKNKEPWDSAFGMWPHTHGGADLHPHNLGR